MADSTQAAIVVHPLAANRVLEKQAAQEPAPGQLPAQPKRDGYLGYHTEVWTLLSPTAFKMRRQLRRMRPLAAIQARGNMHQVLAGCWSRLDWEFFKYLV